MKENRFEIAQLIACLPDEPRYIGDQDVFALQERVIEHILSAEREVQARAAAPTTVDPIQQTVAEELKDALRRQTVDRELAKASIRFLGQSMGRSLHLKLKSVYEAWTATRDDFVMLTAVAVLAEEFSKDRPPSLSAPTLRREDLSLVCFDLISA